MPIRDFKRTINPIILKLYGYKVMVASKAVLSHPFFGKKKALLYTLLGYKRQATRALRGFGWQVASCPYTGIYLRLANAGVGCLSCLPRK